MKKRWTLLMLALVGVMVFGLATAMAQGGRDIQLIVNGESVADGGIKPLLINGRTLVPLRFISEKLGYQVDWNQESMEVTVKSHGKTLRLGVGKREADLAGKKMELDVPAMLYQDRTFVPLRFIAEALDQKVDYDGKNHTAIVGLYPKTIASKKDTVLYTSKDLGFSLNIPKEIFDKLIVVEDVESLTFYHKDTRDHYAYGGRLCQIQKNTSGQMLNVVPSYLLAYKDGSYTIAVLPSDVQADYSRPKAQEDYMEVFKVLTQQVLKTFREVEVETSVKVDQAKFHEGVLSYRVTNLSDQEVTYSPSIKIYELKDGPRKELPLKKGAAFTDVLFPLKPGESREETLALTSMYEGFEPKTGPYYRAYRFTQDFHMDGELVEREVFFEVYVAGD